MQCGNRERNIRVRGITLAASNMAVCSAFGLSVCVMDRAVAIILLDRWLHGPFYFVSFGSMTTVLSTDPVLCSLFVSSTVRIDGMCWCNVNIGCFLILMI